MTMTSDDTFLVPQANRLLEPTEHQDSSEETIWHNPTNRDAILDVYIETPKPGKKPRSWSEQTGKRRYVIKAGETRALPSEFDRAIQHFECTETECLARKFDCRDHTHARVIVGGLGPQLACKGTQRRPMAPAALHPALDDVEARKKALQEERFQAYQRQEANAAELDTKRAELARVDAELAERKRQLEKMNDEAAKSPSAAPAQAQQHQHKK